MAIAKPKFNLNFVNGGNIDPRISCTRSTEASYFGRDGVMRWAAVNEPRLDFDPITLACRGLLVEEARTNLFTDSEQFDNAAWSKAGVLAFGSGSVANAVTAPDGATTADLIVDDTTTATHGVQRTMSLTAGTAYTVSAFVKAKEKNFVRLMVAAGAFSDAVSRRADFDLTTGTLVGVTGTDASGTIKAVGGGVYRVSLTVLATLTASTLVYLVSSVNSGTVFSYTGDGVSGLYIWGAQLEVGKWASSYIRTTTAAVPRGAEYVSMSGDAFNGWFTENGTGSLLCEFDTGNAINTGASRYPLSIDINTTTDRLTFGVNTSNQLNTQVVRGGADGLSYGLLTLLDGVNKAAMTWSATSGRTWLNGTMSVEDTDIPLPNGNMARLILGGWNNTATFPINGYLRRVAYWDSILLSQHLINLTAPD